MAIRVGIVGATGYAGEELIDILLKHPDARITCLYAHIDKPDDISAIFPKFKNRISLICKEPDLAELIALTDLVFLALPHTVSMELAPKLLAKNKKVIDLSADYRFKNTEIYEKFYHVSHKDKKNKAVYGLPEIYRNRIEKAKFIANPGCYPTAAILALAPVVSIDGVDLNSLIIDAKSGTTGGGRKPSANSIFPEVNEDFKAYKINMHQHAPEINQEISALSGKKVTVTFVPHLLPINRGILETIYVKLNSKISTKKVINLYKKFYKKEPFVRIKEEGQFPGIKDVVKTNFCDIGIKADSDRLIIISAIDNLLKGASGQAVQNMNIMYGFGEKTALK